MIAATWSNLSATIPVNKPNNPIIEQDINEKYINKKESYIVKGTKIITNKATAIPTNKPLQTAPAKKADANSNEVKGGKSKSIILPATLALNKDEEAFPKAFWIIAITIKPGAKNSKKGISWINKYVFN